MIAGGASLAPRRWSLPALATLTRSSSGYFATARMTATQKTRNCALSCGLSPGLSRFSPVSVAIDQLLCLPMPLMPGERLLVQQADEAVLLGRPPHHVHAQLVVVGGEVRVLEDRGDLVLARGDLVVPRLDRDAELEHLGLAVGHAGEHALRDRAEVLVFQFLALRRLRAEERPAAVEQVGPGVEEVLVDQEVFLLRADGGEHLLGLGVAEQPQDAQRLVRQRLHRLAAAASSCRAPRRSTTRTRSG